MSKFDYVSAALSLMNKLGFFLGFDFLEFERKERIDV